MRIRSQVVADIAFTAACLAFVALAAVRLRGDAARPSPPESGLSVPGSAAIPKNTGGLAVSLKDAEQLGSTAAALVLIEFSDFQCPYCSRFARETFGSLKAEFIDTGRIRYAFMDFPLDMHKDAAGASEAAACAGVKGRFWDMRDRLFQAQKALTRDDVLGYAVDIGLERISFASCLNGEMGPRVRRNIAEGRRLGVSVTPTFVLGYVQPDGSVRTAKLLRGSHPVQVFRDVINEMLKATSTAVADVQGLPSHQ